MRSTFMGLEASKRGLFTQQSALYTTGHNISNANTQGYTRQRVNMEATLGYPGSGLNAPKTAGNIGTGVQAHSVQRMRDEFVDRQFRQESNKLGYWEATTKSISQMEDIMAEPSEFGINQAFTDFWKSMEDIIDNPKDAAARQVFISKGEALTESFNYMDTQLKLIQGNIGNELNVSTKDISSILKQIAAINKQIQEVEPNGYMPNDLYDARDVLIDQLNDHMPVTISTVPSGGNALAIAEGSVTIKFGDIVLVEGDKYRKMEAQDTDGATLTGEDTTKYFGSFGFTTLQNATVHEAEEKEAATTPISYTDATVTYDTLEPFKGKLISLIDAYGHDDGIGTYPEMIRNLDKLVMNFVTEFNTVHQGGFALDGSPGEPFFSGTSAADFKVVITDPLKVAASDTTGEVGNNENIHRLAALNVKPITDLKNGTFQSYYQSLVGDLAVKGQESLRMEYNSGTLKLQIENNRASMNSVSLDEEMTNMITFQQAYNANARMITVVDETLDKIINGMGRVGL
jgi:flagellar hook-associated protein 1